jgi:hypothetical protein
MIQFDDLHERWARRSTRCETSGTGHTDSPRGRTRFVSLSVPHRTVLILSIGALVAVWLCSFVDPAQATKLPTTPGTPRAAVIDGVPLVPITTKQRVGCEKLANHLKRRVPCPGLLPVAIPVSPTSSAASCLGTVGETACGPAAIQVMGDVFFLSQSNFQVPPDYVGVTFQQSSGSVVPEPSVSGGPLGRFVFMAGPDLQAALRGESGKNVPPVPRYCAPLKATVTVRVHGSAAEVSFHGHSQVNLDLDVAEGDATILVAPDNRQTAISGRTRGYRRREAPRVP